VTLGVGDEDAVGVGLGGRAEGRAEGSDWVAVDLVADEIGRPGAEGCADGVDASA
jgi:hypothetical protein